MDVLSGPLSGAALHDPASAESRLLADLQANILSPHGRDHVRLLIVHFRDAQRGREFLRSRVDGAGPGATLQIMSARQQLDEAPNPSSTLMSVSLSAAGYAALGIDSARMPSDAAFRAGMKARWKWVNDDPAQAHWDAHYAGDAVHALILLADDDAQHLDRQCQSLAPALSPFAAVLGMESGHKLEENGVAIEHFGFADGVSMPTFIDESGSVAAPAPKRWNALTPLSVVLAPCSGGEACFGSYLVLRKLEQNLREFAVQKRRLANALGLTGGDGPEQAAALIIGRHRNGDPLLASATPGDQNDFDYADDLAGLRCPIAGHVRKMNPRGSSEPHGTRDRVMATERRQLLVRRGIPYGERPADKTEANLPEGGVGLLFLAYQTSVVTGFEFVQHMWANWEFATGSPRDSVEGEDLLISQRASEIQAQLVDQNGLAVKHPMKPCILLKGGEYLFTPSLSFFRSL